MKIVAGVWVGLAAATLVLGGDWMVTRTIDPAGMHPLETLELNTYDWRLRATADPASARTDIALIEIDEYSLRNLQPHAGRWPWPRVVHASLLDFLQRAPARVITYDVNFAEPDTRVGFLYGGTTWSGAESDRALAESVKEAGNVILLADASFGGDMPGVEPVPDQGFTSSSRFVPERRVVFPPYPELAAAGTRFGHSLFVLDPDGPLRRTIPFVRTRGRLIPSIGLITAVTAGGIDPGDITLDREALRVAGTPLPLTERTVRTAEGAETYQWALVNYRGPALLPDLKSRPYPTYAFFDLLYSEEQILAGEKPNVDPAVFRDKIVFVGATASGLSDVFETPFAGGKMPGIQVHAAVADDVLSRRFIGAGSDGARIIAVAASAVVIGVVAVVLPAWWAAAGALALVFVLGWVAMRLFAGGYWLNLSQPAIASALALFGGVAYQYFVEGREKRKMKRLFGQYVSKDVFDQLVANPALARLGGQRREMTVLFSDIRGFTSVSERGRPEEIVGMLNEYFSRMVEIVFRHHGTLDKFVGDMVMALFGAPLDDPGHADHAVGAALEMVTALGELNAKWKSEGRPELDIGIGVSSGAMIAGNIGSESIMSYTVIGDTVNLGARLESLNKEYGTRIIISAATRTRLTGRYELRPLGQVVVKGKTEPVAIFEVVGRSGAEIEARA